ncbi:hypothetical protein CXG81DRAFT_25254 [Caulochytrium protostelioides]|uniref:C3H1-type domain-containing protein n=1 Tax=Caulochytrium protostelioides TaxID=1555241 RepID=A0A4P9X9T8_9FUNG|nr:hypothetical protein CXG81DRAFT_25254 [Caulochytrium protostelioides]|eukprot:RKP02098.1 hypothetical protein CXG81DRAFT_25254 [Caulochytrium protostelioides]
MDAVSSAASPTTAASPSFAVAVRPPSTSSSGSGLPSSPAVAPWDEAWMARPARQQVKASAKGSIDAAASGTYNIWYNRAANTPRGAQRGLMDPAPHTCVPARDAGQTRARPGSLFCLFFVRGACPLGARCAYWHRIPYPHEDALSAASHDIFGRPRHRHEREDMGGVGSFERINRILYVGHLLHPDGADAPPKLRTQELDALVHQRFGVWGPIETVRVLADKDVAFVRYRHRCHAEIAKEAMHGQALVPLGPGGRQRRDGDVLNVRWATEDPNPRARAFEMAIAESMVAEAVAQRAARERDGASPAMLAPGAVGPAAPPPALPAPPAPATATGKRQALMAPSTSGAAPPPPAKQPRPAAEPAAATATAPGHAATPEPLPLDRLLPAAVFAELRHVAEVAAAQAASVVPTTAAATSVAATSAAGLSPPPPPPAAPGALALAADYASSSDEEASETEASS